MADDQVKYSDLFESGIVEEINNMKTALQGVVAEITKAKTEANGFRGAMSGMGTATREQQQSVAADAAAIDALNKKVKQLTDEETRLNAAIKKAQDEYDKLTEGKLRYKKLTMDEVAAVEKLRQSLKGSAQEQIAAVQAIDMQSKSYNELYQTYNALKEALNKMTVAERENTEAGKMMVNRAKEIRDTLNNLQQQTGNYTLNVGNYISAMNGLQMQTQQILREIPSAQNLSQFFLAISNNIPMFTDALARYNKGLPEIKAKLAAVTAEITQQEAELAGMNAQSTEYAAKQAQINELRRQEQQLQSASVGGWRAILKSVGSWQTLLIAGLLLLRKMPDIIKWIKERWDRWVNGVREVKNEMNSIAAIARMQADVIEKTADEVNELKLIVERLKDVKHGTDEWAAGVATVNEITKANLDTTKATPAEVEKVTRAYIKQAQQLAKNAVLNDMIAKSQANQVLRDVAYSAADYDTARATLGLEIDSKEDKEFKDLYEAMSKRRSGLKFFEERRGNPAQTTYSVSTGEPIRIASGEEQYQEQKKLYEQSLKEYKNFVNKRLSILSPEAVKKLESEYDLIDPFSTDKGPKDKEPKEQSLTDRYWEAEKALLEEQYEGYELERQLAKLNRDKQRDELINWYVDQRLALDENLKNGFITQEKYDSAIIELDRQNKALRIGITNQYNADIAKINKKQADEELKAKKAQEEAAGKAAKDGSKAELKAAVDGWAEYKAKLVEEGKTRKQIVEAEVAAEIARLNLMLKLNRDVNGEIMSDEQKAKVQEWINLLEKLQQTGNYGNYKPGQFIGKGGANVTNERKNYANIWEVLGIDMDNNQTSALNSVFDQAKEALNSWMDARKAAADQAKELADDEVSAAENALNREIELRNQGYANDVALREKELADAKATQKKAAEEQKKIAGEQILLDAALQTSSMITASANIIKQFPNPLAWGPMLAVMWGAFGYAKLKAYQESQKSIKFKEGGVMLLEGGSHESGHDVNLGIGPDGSNLRAEGGEYFAVINKRSSRKYGSQIPAVVNALNSGMFEDRYIKTSDAVGLMGNVGVVGGMGESADLSRLEDGVGELVKQGEQNWTIEGDYRVLRYKNLTRRVKIG